MASKDGLKCFAKMFVGRRDEDAVVMDSGHE
jgi:hypothetical protein